MISLKFSNKKAYLKDFLRSLWEGALFPVSALASLFMAFAYPIIKYVTADGFKTSIHREISVFSYDYFDHAEQMPAIAMVIFGMLTAIKLFSFAMSKKRVNVYFSFPITRTRMFINRYLAGALELFAAVLVPFTVIYLINIFYFGASAHLTSVYLYLLFYFFTSGLIGLSIGALSAVIAGNIFEAALTAGAISLFPTVIFETVHSLCYYLLKGYIFYGVKDMRMNIISPFTFGIDYNAATSFTMDWDNVDTFHYPLYSLMAVLEDTGEKGWKIPEMLNIDRGFIFPVALWAGIALALIIPAIILFNRRPAEHANSLGKFKLSTAILSALLFFVTIWCILEYIVPINETSTAKICLYLVIGILLIGSVVFFLIQLIFKRKIKAVGKSFAWYGVLTALAAVMIAVVGSQLFGTYNKLPEIEDIKSGAVEIEGPGLFKNYIGEDGTTVFSADGDDLKMLTSLFNEISEEKAGDLQYTNVSFLFKLKNGKSVERCFDIRNEEVYEKYLRTLYNSDYYDLILKERLINGKGEKTADEETKGDGYYSVFFNNNALPREAVLLGENLLADFKNEQGYATISDCTELYKALYDDLVGLSFDTVYKNRQKPFGAIAFSTDDAEKFDSKYTVTGGHLWHSDILYSTDYQYEADPIRTVRPEAGIYIYPEMTNTVNYLKEQGFEIESPYEVKIKEVLYTDGSNSLWQAVDSLMPRRYKGYNGSPVSPLFEYGDSKIDRIFFLDNAIEEGDRTTYDLLKTIYTKSGHPLTSVTSTEQAEKIYNACVAQYDIMGDKGRYVYIIFDDETMVNYYLPQASLNVLK